MNSDEVNWLLQTIEDPEKANRFAQAQYHRGRIPYHVMASLARDRNWTDCPAVEKPFVEEFDLVILGGGAGSTIAAWTIPSDIR
jgi:hypothetical protein